MIFDRIDIFVVCIILGSCLTVAEAYMGFWKGFAQCSIITFLITEVCYTLRCNEKLKKELTETRWKLKCELIETYRKLKDAKIELESAYLEIAKKSKVADVFRLLRDLWKERWEMRTRQSALLQAQDNIETACGCDESCREGGI